MHNTLVMFCKLELPVSNWMELVWTNKTTGAKLNKSFSRVSINAIYTENSLIIGTFRISMYVYVMVHHCVQHDQRHQTRKWGTMEKKELR